MDANTPLGMTLLIGCLLLVAYAIYQAIKSAIVAKNALCEVGEGALIAICRKLSEAELARKAFYQYPWTPVEALVMLKELKMQLTGRVSTPELLMSVGKDEKALLLTFAVFFKFVMSTEEIHQRITFLELVIVRSQGNQPSPERKYSLQLS
jgi:hypothetical protein